MHTYLQFLLYFQLYPLNMSWGRHDLRFVFTTEKAAKAALNKDSQASSLFVIIVLSTSKGDEI